MPATADEVRRELRAIVGEAQGHDAPSELFAYSYDGTFQQASPDFAVTPSSTNEVSALLSLAAREGLPVIPRGAGTSLSGGTIPVGGGLVIGLARMNHIIEIDSVNTLARVEA